MNSIRKKVPLKHLGIKIPLDVHKKLIQAANEDRRSLGAEVIVLLEAALKARHV